MLTRADFKLNLRVFAFVSWLNVIPVAFHPATGQMNCERPSWRKFAFKVVQVLVACQTSFAILNTIRLVGFSAEDSSWEKIPTVIILCVFYLCILADVYCEFDVGVNVSAKIFNEILHITGKHKKKKKTDK
jgi:hypothetical protein